MTLPIKAKPVPSNGFKRSHDRYEIELDLLLQILVPEETFTPRGLEGKTIDISARGMKIVIPQLTTDFYTKLIKGTRYMRIVLNDPQNGEPIKLTGQIAWFDYHKPSAATEAGPCYMGIQFDERSGASLPSYEALFALLKSN